MNLKLTIFLFIFLDLKVMLDNKDFTFQPDYYLIDDADKFREELEELGEDSEEEDNYNQSIYQDDKGFVLLIDNSS